MPDPSTQAATEVEGVPPPRSTSLDEAMSASNLRFAFWRFVHNALIHPLLAFPWAPKWAERAHDWTAAKIPGAG